MISYCTLLEFTQGKHLHNPDLTKGPFFKYRLLIALQHAIPVKACQALLTEEYL